MSRGSVDIIAIPSPADPAQGGTNLDKSRPEIAQAAVAADWRFIQDYQGLQGLVDGIRQTLAAETWQVSPGGPTAHGGCLRTLEIFAHGSPRSINALWDDTIPYFAAQLRQTTLCDAVDIYLSGCNTGLTRPYVQANLRVTESLAQLLVGELPFTPQFPHHITVYGTKGYTTGSQMQGDIATIQTLDGGQTTEHPMYNGAAQASGPACWNAFPNWK